MKIVKYLFVLTFTFFVLSCKKEVSTDAPKEVNNEITYAQGFSLYNYEGYSLLEIKQPWVGATKSLYYVLYTDKEKIADEFKDYTSIQVPVSKVVLTSTTHIPSLTVFEEIESLVGFPGLDYISTIAVRDYIDAGKVKELGQNESLNTEGVIELSPDVLVAFAMDGNNKTLNQLEKLGVPVLYNGDWAENSPLGKAEWIKLFGALYNKQEQAEVFFNSVVDNYQSILNEVKGVTTLPTVMSGAMYQDIWYLPQGESWVSKYFKDAKSNYLWSNSKGVGSLPLSFEEVLETGKDAEFWINPAQYETLEELVKANPHYAEFTAFKNEKIYSFAPLKGVTGGSLFYESAPNRPDIVLKDLVSILHPEIYPDYKPMFYTQLK